MIESLPTKTVVVMMVFLLKIIEPAIIKSLTLLINQIINIGTFPDTLKIAKVIPIVKKDDSS